MQDLKGHELRGLQHRAVFELWILPPAYFSHVVWIEARSRSTCGNAAIPPDEMLEHPPAEFLTDADVRDVPPPAASTKHRVDGRDLRQL
jgi:hypothetical protein